MRRCGPVAVVSAVDDLTADMVVAELNRRGVPVVRCDPADIGTSLSLSAHFGMGEDAPCGVLRTDSRTADLSMVRAVYWRRPSWPDFTDRLGEDDARFAAAQVRHGLGGTLYALNGCRFVNHPLRSFAAEHKPMQLALAHRLGLNVPATLISNNLADIKEFITTQERVIYKTLRWTPYRRDGVGMTTWTELVRLDELDPSVEIVPHLFQALVDKVADVRVTVVGDRVFAVRIDSDLLDWRANYDALSYSVVSLPDALNRTLVNYLEEFGLVFGCFDLCLSKDDDVWWMELNAGGQWGWLEDETGVPISAALADLLEQKAAA